MMMDRPLPSSAEMERAVLACLLQSPDKVIDTVSELQIEDFYSPNHRELYGNALEIIDAGKTLDLPTLDALLSDKGGRIGMEELRSVKNSIATIVNVNSFVKTVKNYSNARKIICACSELAGKAYETTADAIPALLDEAEQSVFSIGATTKEEGFTHVTGALGGAIEGIMGMASGDPRHAGIPTGFMELDKWIIGLRKQEIIVIAARPSLGKTALALNVQSRMAMKGHSIGIVSLEMSKEKLCQRQIFELSGVDSRSLSNGTVTSQQINEDISRAANKLAEMPIYYYDSTPDWPTVRRRIRQAVREHSIDSIMIDYLQLLRLGRKMDSRQIEVAELSANLKMLARELDIPIVILAQLNREAEGKTPKVSDLRESGAVEQDADIIILLDRQRESNDEDTARAVQEGRGIEVKAIVAKNRNGATGTANLLFFPKFTRFEDQSRIYDNDVPRY
jgi:replicative DNA helicase